VTLWELGNEVYGDWVRGHADAETYAKNAKRYAEAMRAVDPGIQLIAVGESSMPDARQWNSAVLRILGRDINYLAVHDYTSRSDNRNNRTTLMARPLEFEARYKEMHALIQQLLPDHPVPFVVNEWNLFYPSTVIQSMEGAVFASRMMNAFERSGEQVSMTSISDLLDGWVGGIIQASRDGVYVTPQYYTIRMYSSHLGTDRLATVVESPNLSEPESKQTVPALDAVATRSEDGKSVFVKLSNADPALSLRTTIALHGKRANAEAEETLLTGPRPDSRNDFAQPDAVHPVTMTIHCDETCSFQMPPDSVAVVTLRLR
jgi:alpha-N-arabinofuranosidase